MTLEQKIADAEAKLHKLYTGASVVEIEVDGVRTKFTPAKIETLEAYILRLRAALAGAAPRGAIGIVF